MRSKGASRSRGRRSVALHRRSRLLASAVACDLQKRGERGEDEEGFEREGLVIGPGKEEVVVGGGGEASDQRDEGRVGVVC